MKTLEIDIETRSGTDLKKSGVYRYCEDPEFDIQLFGYAVDESSVTVIDLACGEQIPEDVLRAIVDEDVIKWAHNASFERICLSTWLRRNRPDLFRSYGTPDDTVGNYLDPVSWRCSQVLCAYNGLPLSLEGAGAVLKLSEQKMPANNSSSILLSPAHRPLPTGTADGTILSMRRKNGRSTENTISAMLRSSRPSGKSCAAFRCRTQFGKNTIFQKQ